MNIYKKWNIGLSIATATIAAGMWLYWEYVCKGGSCSWELRNFLFRPLIWGNLALAIIFTSLLVFPSRFFRQWLIHIASWSVILSLYFILQEDPRSSNILSVGRGLLSWALGTLIFILTILYALGWHIYEWRKGRIQGKDFAKLSVFMVSGAIFYVIWQLF